MALWIRRVIVVVVVVSIWTEDCEGGRVGPLSTLAAESGYRVYITTDALQHSTTATSRPKPILQRKECSRVEAARLVLPSFVVVNGACGTAR